eukprot:6186172-Pleurochrysis_carterae.AAC.2
MRFNSVQPAMTNGQVTRHLKFYTLPTSVAATSSPLSALQSSVSSYPSSARISDFCMNVIQGQFLEFIGQVKSSVTSDVREALFSRSCPWRGHDTRVTSHDPLAYSPRSTAEQRKRKLRRSRCGRDPRPYPRRARRTYCY